MGNIVTLDFHGNQLLGFTEPRGRFVALRPLVLGMGLNWSGQLQRLKRDPILSEGVCVMHTPSDSGGEQETVCLPLDLVPGFLFRIDAQRVRADVRDRVIVFQRECYAALAGAFGQGQPIEPPAPEANARLSWNDARKMVTEARQTHGLPAARQMWFRLGLPTVPAMFSEPQPDLFDVAPSGGRH